MGGGSGGGGVELWAFCPRCKRQGLMYGECQFEDCDYPRWPAWAAFLIMCLPAAVVIAVVLVT